MTSPATSLSESAEALHDELTELRHRLHREPEVGLKLPRTQDTVLEAIDGLGLEVTTGQEVTSVTAVLRGGQPGPLILLRGDMDALPVHEEIDVDFRSRVDGAMHACGHDLHTTMLAGAARLLADRRDQLAGDVLFMFQPGEEGWDGAGRMIDEGVLDAAGRRPDAAYALHVMSGMTPRGTVTTRPGPLMAASDGLLVTVHGAGGHGSIPHMAKDPVPAACEMVLALQTMMSRTIDPFAPAVLTVGSFHAGTRRNIIPETVTFEATVRTFDPQVQAQITEAAIRTCEGIAHAHGLTVEARYDNEYPLTVNSDVEAGFAAGVAADILGESRYEEMVNPITGSEDFSRVLQAVPGAMLFLGACLPGRDHESAPSNHSPYAAFDDSVLSDGAALYAELAVRRMAHTPG